MPVTEVHIKPGIKTLSTCNEQWMSACDYSPIFSDFAPGRRAFRGQRFYHIRPLTGLMLGFNPAFPGRKFLFHLKRGKNDRSHVVSCFIFAEDNGRAPLFVWSILDPRQPPVISRCTLQLPPPCSWRLRYFNFRRVLSGRAQNSDSEP